MHIIWKKIGMACIMVRKHAENASVWTIKMMGDFLSPITMDMV